MGDIEDLGSAILVKVQESFTWKFVESTSDNLDSFK
jgi:hypothetical protein